MMNAPTPIFRPKQLDESKTYLWFVPSQKHHTQCRPRCIRRISHDANSIVAPPEIAHQILFVPDDTSKTTNFKQYDKLVWDYLWQSTTSGGFTEATQVESLIPGLGMAANSFLPMVNSRSLMGKIDSAGMNVVVGDEEYVIGPGSGAFSVYHDTTYIALNPMEAGAEVFVD